MKNKTGKFIAVFSAFLLAEGSSLCGMTIPAFAAENTTVNATADSSGNTQNVLSAADASADGGVFTGTDGTATVAGTDTALNAAGGSSSLTGVTTDPVIAAAQADGGTQNTGAVSTGTAAADPTATAAGAGTTAADSTATAAGAAGTATATGTTDPAAAAADGTVIDPANAATADPTADSAEGGTASVDAAAADAAALAAAQAAAAAAASDPNLTNTNVVGANGWTGRVLTRSRGVNYGPSGKETYYNLNMSRVVAAMRRLGYEGEYWVRNDGVKMFGQYILCAANLKKHKRGSIIETSLGTAIVADTGSFSRYGVEVDIAVTW